MESLKGVRFGHNEWFILEELYKARGTKWKGLSLTEQWHYGEKIYARGDQWIGRGKTGWSRGKLLRIIGGHWDGGMQPRGLIPQPVDPGDQGSKRKGKKHVEERKAYHQRYRTLWRAIKKLERWGLVETHWYYATPHKLTSLGKRVVEVVRPIKERGQPIRWDRVAKRLEK